MRLQVSIQQKRRNQSRAVTFLDVLIAAGIGGFVFISLFLGIAQSAASAQRARENLRATQILLEKFEVIRLYNWDQVTTKGFIPETFTEYYSPAENNGTGSGVVYEGTITVTSAPVPSAYSSTMLMVIGEITWVSREGIQHQRRMETLISQHGVQNYIY